MINGEKYRDELLKFIEKRDAGSFTFSKGEEGNFWQCGEKPCCECGMVIERSNCSLVRLKWLLSEYKEPVKLTKLEHGILEYLLENRQYGFVVRERDGFIYIYKSNPKKDADGWKSLSLGRELGPFNNLFQFVHWEDSEPTSIQEVLSNCEVIKNESDK
ncbi:hypothetical protein [uncultured Catenibacterium sp.]|uniref:hypothetical protein n=1 Tax=uncultured Catenibacterium sp. TaxID=286142 RepID=UPI0025E0C6EA|nr:hypothetical protein [uncultured Catenibacterium sp.]